MATPMANIPDYNWPFPKRDDLMSLNTITQEKDLCRVKTATYQQRQRSTSMNMVVDDIRGASPKKWIPEKVNRPEFQNQNWDIERSCPRALHILLNKPEYNLTNGDIEKSKPNFTKFSTTRPPSNPLNPVYKLAHVEYFPPEPPKFIRDNMEIEDIDGARPKKQKYYETRDSMKVADIDGAIGKPTYIRKTDHDSFNYADITKVKFASTRVTDNMDPRYKTRDDKGNVIDYGWIKGSTPTMLPFRNNPPSYSYLKNQDIGGTQVGSRTMGNFGNFTRSQWIKTNNTIDVPGAQVGTMKKCFSSNRNTNPLNPTYVVPGSSELGPNYMSNAFGDGPRSSMDPRYDPKAHTSRPQTTGPIKAQANLIVTRKDESVKENIIVNEENRPQTMGSQRDYIEKSERNEPVKILKSADQQSHKSQILQADQQSQRNQIVRAQTAGSQRSRQALEGSAKPVQPSPSVHEADIEGRSSASNAAKFFDTEKGTLPAAIKKPSLDEVKSSKGFSVMNQQKLNQDEQAMERDPKFMENKDKFYQDQAKSAKRSQRPQSQGSVRSRLSAAQKLDQFIGP